MSPITLQNKSREAITKCYLLILGGVIAGLFSSCIFAFGGNDLAAGIADDLVATEKGSFTTLAYAAEFLMALYFIIVKRNITQAIGIFLLAAFITFVGAKFLS